MRCTWCGEKIEDDPVWKKDKPYCSEECAEMDTDEDEEKEEENDDENEDEEE
jgi:hypothetical protein